MSYVDVKLPDELKKKILDLLKKMVYKEKRQDDKEVLKIKKEWKVKKGMNECTKAIERNAAKFLVLAGDITPAEVVMHIPKIAAEKKVPYGFVDTKADLGKACGLSVECSAIAIMEMQKDAEAELKEIVNAIGELRK